MEGTAVASLRNPATFYQQSHNSLGCGAESEAAARKKCISTIVQKKTKKH
jgi:hypothetical protein